MGNFKDLNVWKRAVDLAVTIYEISKDGPISKDFGMKDQIRRASVSVASNIAEGDDLKSDAQALRHFYYSRGSLAELITQLIICRKVEYLNQEVSDPIIHECEEISKMLNALINYRSNNKIK